MIFFSNKDKRPAVRHGWPCVYFHSDLEDVVARLGYHPPDLVASDTHPDTVKDGAYDVEVYGMKAKLFFWSCGQRDFLRVSWKVPDLNEKKLPFEVEGAYRAEYRTGLIVLPDDAHALTYAKKLFDAKQEHI